MEVASIKDEAIRMIQKLPEDATWDDLMHEIYVRQAIESGMEDSRLGRTVDVRQVRAQFGLSE